jgi:hypothetical protein
MHSHFKKNRYEQPHQQQESTSPNVIRDVIQYRNQESTKHTIEQKRAHFNEYFTTQTFEEDKNTILVVSCDKYGWGSIFTNRFDINHGILTIENAEKGQNWLHLSDALYLQYEHVCSLKRKPFILQEIAFPTITNTKTKHLIAEVGSGTFEKNTQNFTILSASRLIKALHYIRNEHSHIFQHKKLTRLIVKSPERSITCIME